MPALTPQIIQMAIVIGATFVATMAALWLGLKLIGRADRSARLEQLSQQAGSGPQVRETVRPIFLEDEERSMGAWERMRVFQWLRNRLEGAGMDWTVATFLGNIAISIGLGVMLGLFFPLLGLRSFSMVLYGLLASSAPWIVLAYKHSTRMRTLEEQLPEAVDFIARATRAGHAFTVALEMLSAEGPDPIKTEFRKVHTQISLGGDLESALRQLIERVPFVDMRFFVSSILLQRETGGNLSEILTALGNTVRERMRLRGQVRAATAHGRMTAMILSAIPVVLVIFLSSRNPEHMKVFVEHPTGRLLGIWVLASQIIGYLVIRKMINFKI